MLHKFLCFIGLHKWFHYPDVNNWMQEIYWCGWCGKNKIGHRNRLTNK